MIEKVFLGSMLVVMGFLVVIVCGGLDAYI